MSARPVAVVALLLLLLVPALFVTLGVASPSARAAGTPSVTGSFTGPAVVATGSTTQFHISGYGGPAFSANGTLVGNISYFTTLVASNLTGISISPPTAKFTHNNTITANLVSGDATETLSIQVMISSVGHGKNQSTNLSLTVHIVRPYVISTTVVNSSPSVVTGFTLDITLDDRVIGNATVPTLQPAGKYVVTFSYATLGLSSGEHTFGISLAQEHGLVTFSGGQTQFSETVYVTGPPPDYTVWYIAGIAAFFGAIFIFASRVAARRRGATRR